MVTDNNEGVKDGGRGGTVCKVSLDSTRHGRHEWWEFVLAMIMGSVVEGVFGSIDGGRRRRRQEASQAEIDSGNDFW